MIYITWFLVSNQVVVLLSLILYIYIHESRRVRSNLFNLEGRRLGGKVQDSLFFQILLDRIEGKIMEDGCIGK